MSSRVNTGIHAPKSLKCQIFQVVIIYSAVPKHINDRSANDRGCLLPNGND